MGVVSGVRGVGGATISSSVTSRCSATAASARLSNHRPVLVRASARAPRASTRALTASASVLALSVLSVIASKRRSAVAPCRSPASTMSRAACRSWATASRSCWCLNISARSPRGTPGLNRVRIRIPSAILTTVQSSCLLTTVQSAACTHHAIDRMTSQSSTSTDASHSLILSVCFTVFCFTAEVLSFCEPR